MGDLSDYDQISSDHSTSVTVPECTPATRLQAATMLAETVFGEDVTRCPKALAAFAAAAEETMFARHVTEPDGVCDCEDTSWWCPAGDGPVRHFWTFDSTALSHFEQDAYDERRSA